jgi:hypothetical protein
MKKRVQSSGSYQALRIFYFGDVVQSKIPLVGAASFEPHSLARSATGARDGWT